MTCASLPGCASAPHAPTCPSSRAGIKSRSGPSGRSPHARANVHAAKVERLRELLNLPNVVTPNAVLRVAIEYLESQAR